MIQDFPEILRKVRILWNYSQEYVAEQVGVSLSSYSRYEQGKVQMDFYIVVRLAALYKMSVDQLIHYGDPKFKIEDAQANYLKRSKVMVTVELDGLKDTLEISIKKLTAINDTLAGIRF